MIVDLSVTLNEQTPVYPGDPTVKIDPVGVLEKDGWCDHLLTLGTHVGTHIDAPAHMIQGGKTLNQMPVEQFIGSGKYIKVEGQFDLESIKRTTLQEGDVVIFHTGMQEQYHEESYFEEHPCMSEEIAKYLVKAKVKMVGLDTGNVDNQDGFPIHKILLGGEVLIIENLTNLQELQGKEFKIYALPLNLEIDGSPARVIADV